MNIKYYDLHYTVYKNRDDKYEKNYNNFNDYITPNHYIGPQKDNVILK